MGEMEATVEVMEIMEVTVEAMVMIEVIISLRNKLKKIKSDLYLFGFILNFFVICLYCMYK